MDKEFQTTFIPKKNLTQEAPQSPQSKARGAALGIFPILAGIAFFIGIVAAGGAFTYELLLERRIETMRESLARSRGAFEPSLIVELRELDRRLSVANNLLRSHISVSPVFRVIEEVTLQSVKYDSFSYTFQDSHAAIEMNGIARDYKTVAEQSQILGRNQFASDHIFSNFTLNNQGNVQFNLGITVGPELVLFENSLGRAPQNTMRPESHSAINEFLSSQATDGADGTLDESEPVGIPSLEPPVDQSLSDDNASVN